MMGSRVFQIERNLGSLKSNISASIENFDEGAGDYCSLILDIDKMSALVSKGTPIAKVKTCFLKLNDPRIIAKYTSTLHTFDEKHNLYWKVLQLNAISITYLVEKRVLNAYESINALRVKGM